MLSLVRLACGALLLAISLFVMSLAPAHAASDAERPRIGSAEYRLSWGVAASRAGGAYRRGVTGAGIVVAMVDTGLDASSARMFSHLSPQSVDLVPDRRLDMGDRSHGEQTASLLAARADNAGTFGIAYDATLLSIRADRDGSCLRICAFDPAVLARAIDYAVDHGARIIGLPLASRRPIPVLEPALERAVARGVVIVAAAGNDGADEPVWPARYAADPRFSSSMIVTGATTPGGSLAKWSNKAGVVRDRFVAAPGENVAVDCGQRNCYLASGTSYSVSYAAGALALVMSRDASLTGPHAAALLLGHARAPQSGRADWGEAGSTSDARSDRSIARRVDASGRTAQPFVP